MAADFSTIGTRNLGATSSVTSVPLTIACWFNTPANSAQKTLVSVGASGATHRCFIQVSANQLGAVALGTITAGSTFSTAHTGDVWNHACGVFSATNSRTAYLNGSAATTNTSSMAQNAFNDVRIGARWATTLGVYMRGLLAEVGVWDVALNNSEIVSLYDGINCSKIRPESLVFYSPLIRNFTDIVGGQTISNNNGVTAADHPRIYY